MSQTIDCPKCGRPMDVPAYPGDGVYKIHTCDKFTVFSIGRKPLQEPDDDTR